MLRSVVGALATKLMLVQYNSDMPILLACSGSQGDCRELGIIGTASLGRPRKRAVRQATVGGPASQATVAAGPSARSVASSIDMRCRITPMRPASATIARFGPRRLGREVEPSKGRAPRRRGSG